MVRSSIACNKCRKSKVKCDNNGVDTVCKACALGNKECTYPGPGSMPTPKRADTASGFKQEEGESKKRVRKVEDVARRSSQRAGEDALDANVLTKKVWQEVYDIFKLHFSTEMPFLHAPTFRKRMFQAANPRDVATPIGVHDGKVLFLGVLTLTARFHPELIAYHASPSSSPDPLSASEYYSTALAAALGPMTGALTNPSLEIVQAILMLALYEWGQTRGLTAWLYVGIATRLAQSMGLPYEDDEGPFAKNYSSRGPATNQAAKEGMVSREVTEKEARRRTWWSCFIMDRMLVTGKSRPTMIDVEMLRVRLPCSDYQFLFMHDVKTGALNKGWLRPIEMTNDEGVLGWYIRLVELCGRFAIWSFAGGRFSETLPPWDPETNFYKLRAELAEFQRALPSNLAFTEDNLSAHIENRNATAYASMHTLYSFCVIMLHREYIPFIPIRSKKGPSGPLDEPTFPPDKFSIPPGFWEDSAQNIFKAARDIIHIVRTCQDENVLPESPQIVFAIWQAAFVSLYAFHFPYMDTLRQLHDPSQVQGTDINRSWTGITDKLFKDIAPRLTMTKGFRKMITKMHAYFCRVKTDILGLNGGGLDQYKNYEPELKEFGKIEDPDKRDQAAELGHSRSRSSTYEIGTTPSIDANIRGDSMHSIEPDRPRLNGSWVPVNSQPPFPLEAQLRERSNPSGQFPYGIPFQQSPNQSRPPSLISHNNGDSSSSLSSPYSHHQQFHGSQPQPTPPFTSMAQHSQSIMAPPPAGRLWSPDKERQMTRLERVSWRTNFDNLGQDINMEEDWNGISPNGQNFIQAALGGWDTNNGFPVSAPDGANDDYVLWQQTRQQNQQSAGVSKEDEYLLWQQTQQQAQQQNQR